MHYIKTRNKFIQKLHVSTLILFLASYFSLSAHAEIINNEKIIGNRIVTLWADKKECLIKGAYLISIESIGNTYKIAGCVTYGCRVSIPEFGKKTRPFNYKNDPKLIWLNDKSFKTSVYGKMTTFHKCKM